MAMYKSKLENEQLDDLFEAMQKLETREDYYRFFEDISTISEINALAQRFAVAKMLDEEMTYTDIANLTGASTATISRVKRCLNYGADGYQLVLKRLKEDN
ncbi:MAG: TrpR-like protein YerC/YecD [Peptococcaceae bacterium]|nr:TrpR-like protein YerC/YecD [Peptococcaceae bacterium]